MVSLSKDACNLCYALIRMYGKIHTQRCHGRLYPGWQLPHCSDLNDIARQFNRRLEENLRQSVIILLKEKKKLVHPVPKEGTLSSLPVSASTSVVSSKPDTNNGQVYTVGYDTLLSRYSRDLRRMRGDPPTLRCRLCLSAEHDILCVV